jgi:hypothetical protein
VEDILKNLRLLKALSKQNARKKVNNKQGMNK